MSNVTVDSIFIKASRMKLRFASSRGELNIEDLWDIGTTRGAVNLNDLAKSITRQLKTTEEEGLVKTKSAANDVLELKLEILKYVFEVRQSEANEAVTAAENKEKNQLIMKLIAEKKNQELASKTIEELQALMK